MSNETITHTTTNCAAKAAGICDRAHLGDTVKVVVEQVGFGDAGEVLDINPLGAIRVRFPHGATNAEDYGMDKADTEIMHYIESELEVVPV